MNMIIDPKEAEQCEIEMMLEELLEFEESNNYDFVRSLDEWYQEKGFLSPKQKAILKEMYDERPY